jgi:hypothetical protein
MRALAEVAKKKPGANPGPSALIVSQRLRLDDLVRLVEALLRRPPLALARSLCAELLRLLACAPLRPASERLMPPVERDEDEEELRDAIDHSFACVSPLCGAARTKAVGPVCGLL